MTTSLNVALLETVKMTVRQLESVPGSPEKAALHECCLLYLDTLEQWVTSPPDQHERTRMINAVLSTHKRAIDLARRVTH